MTKEYNTIKKIMSRWGESEENMWIWKLNTRHIMSNCEDCRQKRNMGHIVWWQDGDKHRTCCRKCLVNKEISHGNMVEEIVMGIDYDYTVAMRKQLLQIWKWDRMSEAELEELWGKEEFIDKDEYEEWKKKMGY